MADISDYLEDGVLDFVLNAAVTHSLTSTASVFIALADADWTDAWVTDTPDVEPPNTFGYARVTATQDFAALSVGIWDNTSVYSWTASGGQIGTGPITHTAILDATTDGAGNLLFHGNIDTSKTIADGDTFQFAADAYVVTLV